MDTTVSDPLVGRLVEGRYRVESRVARGGMATLYAALDTRLDRRVALKVMHPALAEDAEFVKRFIREAKSAAQLSHPDVVAVYDQGRDGDVVYLAMEFVEGRTLRDLLRERGRLDSHQALAILAPVLAALAAAHDAGIVHRDVKPENVLLADDGRVKVADFGLARAVASSTHTSTSGVLIGTVAYLAPEQVARGVADPRSDVYSAGVLLYEMLTGEPPYDGDTPISVAYRHVHEDIPAPSLVAPSTPAAVDALVERATDRDPDHRFADAAAMLTEVTRLRGDLSATPLPPAAQADPPDLQHTLVVPLAGHEAPPAAPVKKARKSSGRRRSRGWIALLLVLLLAAGAAGAGWWYGSGRYTTVPGLLNLTEDEATATAKKHGFKVTFGDPVFDEVVPSGHVVTENPKPGDRVLRNSTLRLQLSKGPERFTVPDLVGKQLSDAERMLAESHLIAATPIMEEWSDEFDAGAVIRTDPGVGEPLKKDSAVSLVVSKGPQPVTVPDVRNLPKDKAIAKLKDADLKPSVTGEEFSDSVPAGSVISQSVSGTVAKKTPVGLVISKGPELIRVPDVTGEKLDKARKILEGLGFKVATIEAPFGPKKVYDQNPGPDAMKPRGTKIQLFVV